LAVIAGLVPAIRVAAGRALRRLDPRDKPEGDLEHDADFPPALYSFAVAVTL
jgi:hypothetical protein